MIFINMNEQTSEFPNSFLNKTSPLIPDLELSKLLHAITPLGWFAIYCKEAVNPLFPEEERRRSRLLANAHLDTAAFLDVFEGQQVAPEQIPGLIVSDPRVRRRKFELLQGLRTAPDKPDSRFDSKLATAIDRLFPVKPTRRVVSKLT